ncbi:MAG: DUF4249 domain-containing protein [Tunicatimonas sp.]
MSFRKYFSAYAVGLILLANACVEPIDFDTDPVGGQLIVTGGITNAAGTYEVVLKETDENRAFPVPVGGAAVTLRNDQGQRELLREQDTGQYRTSGEIRGQPGDTYELEIVLADGTVYRSRPETMPSAIGKDSAYYEIGKQEKVSDSGVLFEERVLKVFADTQLPEDARALYLKWDVEGVYSVTTIIYWPLGDRVIFCYFYDKLNAQEIHLFDRRATPEGNALQKQLLAAREIDYSFLERHYFNVIQSSLTAEAYDYWDQVGQLSNRTGSVFDTPPGLVRGNVYNVEDAEEPVLGYFGAALVDTTRFFLNRTDFAFNVSATCPCTSFRTQPSYPPYTIGSICPCTKCDELAGVRLDPPSYF